MHAVVVSGKARAAAHTVLNADVKHAVTLLRDGFAVFHTTRIYCDALNIVSTHAAADNAGTRLRMLISYNNLDLAAAAAAGARTCNFTTERNKPNSTPLPGLPRN